MIKNNLGVDAISRKAVLNLPKRTMKNYFGEVVGDVVYVKDIMELPPVIPQEPTSKNDLGVDCISRADAIRVASGYCHPSNVAKELAKLPPVTPQEQKIGHWIKSNIGGAKVCSVCNAHMGLSSFKFCPNCGTKMVEPQKSEDKE